MPPFHVRVEEDVVYTQDGNRWAYKAVEANSASEAERQVQEMIDEGEDLGLEDYIYDEWGYKFDDCTVEEVRTGDAVLTEEEYKDVMKKVEADREARHAARITETV